eukprot:655822-Pleurochrysis_carterae.AAC.1
MRPQKLVGERDTVHQHPHAASTGSGPVGGRGRCRRESRGHRCAVGSAEHAPRIVCNRAHEVPRPRRCAERPYVLAS